jgi:dodecin
MKAVKEAKRPVGSRGRTGRDGAIDFALKIEESAAETAAIDEHVYRVIEIVGSSPRNIEAAVESALSRAHSTIRNLRWFEVIRTSGQIEDGKARHYQVTLKVGFTMEAPM